MNNDFLTILVWKQTWDRPLLSIKISGLSCWHLRKISRFSFCYFIETTNTNIRTDAPRFSSKNLCLYSQFNTLCDSLFDEYVVFRHIYLVLLWEWQNSTDEIHYWVVASCFCCSVFLATNGEKWNLEETNHDFLFQWTIKFWCVNDSQKQMLPVSMNRSGYFFLLDGLVLNWKMPIHGPHQSTDTMRVFILSIKSDVQRNFLHSLLRESFKKDGSISSKLYIMIR